MNYLKIIKYVGYSLLFLFLIFMLILPWVLYYNNKKDLKIANNNNAAYQVALEEKTEQNIAFQLTVEQLQYFNDSITLKMKEVQKKLEIKNKNLKQLTYIQDINSKTDTICFRDTIFVPNLNIDTTIVDYWYQLELNLKYPDSIKITPEFKNEYYVVHSIKKTTVDPPKKYWIQRIFQKKHKVIEINVINNNPYSSLKESRIIDIIK